MALIACLAVMLPAHSQSENQMESISKMLDSSGYSVTQASDKTIKITRGSRTISATINGPDGDISYVAYPPFTRATTTLEQLNTFNRDVKFGRAYFDKDGDVVIQMDRNGAGGSSLDGVKSDVDVAYLLYARLSSDLRDD